MIMWNSEQTKFGNSRREKKKTYNLADFAFDLDAPINRFSREYRKSKLQGLVFQYDSRSMIRYSVRA